VDDAGAHVTGAGDLSVVVDALRDAELAPGERAEVRQLELRPTGRRGRRRRDAVVCTAASKGASTSRPDTRLNLFRLISVSLSTPSLPPGWSTPIDR
jgi:hypothetical protein